MRERTRKLTATALMLAVAVVCLYVASVMPTWRLAISALAGLCVAACVIEGGLLWGLACWVGASVLGLVLVPDKGDAIFFVVFFGIYPVLKSLFERLKSRPLEWVLKFAFFNFALALCCLAWKLGLMPEIALESKLLWLLCLGGNVVFWVFDIGFSKLIAFYIARVAIKRKGK